MGRRTASGTSRYDVEPWPDSLGVGFRVASEKELAARAQEAAVAAGVLERWLGPDSDIAQMLGLAPAIESAVAA